MNFLFGTPSRVFRRDFTWFVFIQVLIWIKVVFAFFLFGVGITYSGLPVLISVPFAYLPAFAYSFQWGEWVFHQVMHVSIAAWVFLLAKHVRSWRWSEMSFLFLVAVSLHNVGYWLTSTHPSFLFSVRDFLFDYFTLWGFFLFFRWVFRVFPQGAGWKIPFLEGTVVGNRRLRALPQIAYRGRRGP